MLQSLPTGSQPLPPRKKNLTQSLEDSLCPFHPAQVPQPGVICGSSPANVEAETTMVLATSVLCLLPLEENFRRWEETTTSHEEGALWLAFLKGFQIYPLLAGALICECSVEYRFPGLCGHSSDMIRSLRDQCRKTRTT